MKRIVTLGLSLIATLCFDLNANAQVGIGTTAPDASSLLDVTATDKGVLLPRVSLVDVTNGTTPVNTPTTSLLVYNTNAAVTGGSGAGYYYWNGTEWVRLTTKPSSDWTLTGNNGTNATVNFIGTTDNVDMVVRTNNTERIRIKNAGKVGIGETNPTNGALEVAGNVVIGNTFTGGTATAQTGGLTVEGRSIVGEDNFFYAIDKFVVYGNTTWIPGQVTNGDNGNGLTYAINAYTSGGTGLYAEDNDGGTGLEVSVDDGTLNTGAMGVRAIENSGRGTAVIGDMRNAVAGAGAIAVHGSEASTNGWALFATGDLNVTGGTFNISDRKLKKNIQPISGALDLVNQLTPTTYEMRWDDKRYANAGFSKKPQFGFIAQEVEAVLPNIIKASSIPLNNANYTKKEISENPKLAALKPAHEAVKSVNYIQLIPVLTQAIKEQQAQIDALKKELNQLQK